MDGMEAALEEARKAMVEGEVPVGAALLRGEEILWADHNRREQRQDPTAHAEMLCLRVFFCNSMRILLADGGGFLAELLDGAGNASGDEPHEHNGQREEQQRNLQNELAHPAEHAGTLGDFLVDDEGLRLTF